MAVTLRVFDEKIAGGGRRSVELVFPAERLTVRELIRERIYQEVQDYNLKATESFNGLVEPSNAERTLNGFKLREGRKIDWLEQYQKALEAFERNGFFIMVADRQVERLDEVVLINPETEVSFVKLVPLVGG